MTHGGPWNIVVDGANVAFEEPTANGKPRLHNVELALGALRKQYRQIVVIIDAALHHKIDDPAGLEQMLRDHIAHQAPAETSADYFILETAERLQADVLSNDTFRQYHEHWPWIEYRRIPYMIIDDRFILYRPAQVESRVEHKVQAGEPAGRDK